MWKLGKQYQEGGEQFQGEANQVLKMGTNGDPDTLMVQNIILNKWIFI